MGYVFSFGYKFTQRFVFDKVLAFWVITRKRVSSMLILFDTYVRGFTNFSNADNVGVNSNFSSAFKITY